MYDFHWKREYSLFYGVACLYSLMHLMKEELKEDVQVRGEYAGGWFSVYSAPGSKAALQETMFEKFRHGASAIQKELRQIQKGGEDFIAFAKNLRITAKTPQKTLLRLYGQYYRKVTEWNRLAWISFYLVESSSTLIEQWVAKMFSTEQIPKAIAYYSRPKEKASQLQIADYFKKAHSTKEKVSYLQKHFPWLASADPFHKPFAKQDFAAYTAAFVQPEEAASCSREEQRMFAKFEHTPVVRFYQEMLYLKDKRDDYRREAFHYACPLVEELAKRLQISLRELGHLLPQDIPSKLLRKEIKKREKGFIIEIKKGKYHIQAGTYVLRNSIRNQVPEGVQEIKGAVGSPGFARGKVQMIRNLDDVKRFRQGNILVAVTTNPNHVPAMHKAAAIVTDEGGITSHAAIVAREMKKPCIVGTKIVTRILKDGDLVEVDAEKGIVKKITSMK